jgi:hypothetical protein
VIGRVLWLGIGIGIGVAAVTRAQRAARSLSPDAIAGRAVQGLGGFWRDVRDGMREREEQLREATGLSGELEEGPAA